LENGFELSVSIYPQNTAMFDAIQRRPNANLTKIIVNTTNAVVNDAPPTSFTRRLGRSEHPENSMNTLTAELIQPNAIKSPQIEIRSLKLNDCNTFSYEFMYP
jgi:hypothetical protein